MECQFCKSPLKDIGGVMYCAKECTEYAAWFDYEPEHADTLEDLQDRDEPPVFGPFDRVGYCFVCGGPMYTVVVSGHGWGTEERRVCVRRCVQPSLWEQQLADQQEADERAKKDEASGVVQNNAMPPITTGVSYDDIPF